MMIDKDNKKMQRSVRRLVLGVAILAILSGCVENVKGNDACHEENPPRVLNYLNFLRQNDYRIPDDVARLYEAGLPSLPESGNVSSSRLQVLVEIRPSP